MSNQNAHTERVAVVPLQGGRKNGAGASSGFGEREGLKGAGGTRSIYLTPYRARF